MKFPRYLCLLPGKVSLQFPSSANFLNYRPGITVSGELPQFRPVYHRWEPPSKTKLPRFRGVPPRRTSSFLSLLLDHPSFRYSVRFRGQFRVTHLPETIGENISNECSRKKLPRTSEASSEPVRDFPCAFLFSLCAFSEPIETGAVSGANSTIGPRLSSAAASGCCQNSAPGSGNNPGIWRSRGWLLPEPARGVVSRRRWEFGRGKWKRARGWKRGNWLGRKGSPVRNPGRGISRPPVRR